MKVRKGFPYSFGKYEKSIILSENYFSLAKQYYVNVFYPKPEKFFKRRLPKVCNYYLLV